MYHFKKLKSRETKKTFTIGAASARNILHRATPDLRNLRRHQGYKRRVIGLSAMRNWRQLGAVGLDQKPVQRHPGGDVAQILGGFEGDDA